MIYLASPYSHDDPDVRQARFVAACRYAAERFACGEHVFSPIAHSHPVALHAPGFETMPTTFAFWRRWDHEMITLCHLVRVLKLPGWEDSAGVQDEIAFAAEMGRPVEYAEPSQ